MNQQPIVMPNRKLAEAMITAGIPFASREEEEYTPTMNQYTPGLLRDKRIIGGNPISPKKFEEAVLETADRKIQGSVTFFFRRTKEAEDCVAAWDKTADLIRQYRQRESFTPEEMALLDPLPPLPSHSAEVIAEVLCMHANNLKAIQDLVFINPPVCNTLSGEFYQGESKGGEKLTSTGVPIGETTGGGRTWSTSLGNADRARIGLHPKIRP